MDAIAGTPAKPSNRVEAALGILPISSDMREDCAQIDVFK
jgi:hypothetical protein